MCWSSTIELASLPNQIHYKNTFVETVHAFAENFEVLSQKQRIFYIELLTIYEIYTRKLAEILSKNPPEIIVDEKTVAASPIVQFEDKNYFKGFMVDFEYMNLNEKFISVLDRDYYPLNVFFEARNALPQDEFKIVNKLVLLLNKENQMGLSADKINRLKDKARILFFKRSNVRFFLMYMFLYLAQKERNIEINPEIIEIVEDLIVDYIPNFFTMSKVDYESLIFIIYVCYEIHFCSLDQRDSIFSHKFLRFLKGLGVWHKEQLWAQCIEIMKKIAVNPFIDLYYSSPRHQATHGCKVQVKYIKDIYEFAVFVGFHLLKVPFNTLFDIFNAINEKSKDININAIIDISKELEEHFEKTFTRVSSPNIDFGVSNDRRVAIEMILKKALKFLSFKEDKLLCLLHLNKYFYRKFSSVVFKQALYEENISLKTRVRLWQTICESDSDLQIFLDKDDLEKQQEKLDKILQMSNLVHLIKLDVKRTSFINDTDRTLLESVLLKTAKNFPSILYYQGMNCIGGFLTIYSQSEELSYNVLNYLIKNKLEKYFRNNFSQLNKILFVSEKLLAQHNPEFMQLVLQNNIKTDFYLSPLVLTIFTCTLQYVDAKTLVSKLFDLFIAGGWKFIFRFVVYLSMKITHTIKGLRHEMVLMFLKKDIFEVMRDLESSSLKAQLLDIPISSSEIREIEQEYNRSRFIVDVYWAEFYENKKLRIKMQKSG